MAAQTVEQHHAEADPLIEARDPVAAAEESLAGRALTATHSAGRVGLELELHLVDLARPARRPDWTDLTVLLDRLSGLPGGSRLTVEPGGQLELSTPTCPSVSHAVATLRTDRAALRGQLRDLGYGAAPLGADPVRHAHRVNPRPRYVAMERHFDARGHGPAGRAMMSTTAALQVNLDAGPAAGWVGRLERIGQVLPVLAAVSATSPVLAGHRSGWRSMRQQAWSGLDPRRAGAVAGLTAGLAAAPGDAWASYALDAPVMLRQEGERLLPFTRELTLRDWLGDPGRVGRRATSADVDLHLTTLFPPLRPRGYLEIRCLDAAPDRWWPALAAVAVTLTDEPVAADLAADLCAPLDLLDAARDGAHDPQVRRVLAGCLDLAARWCPDDLRPEVEALAELVASGRTPYDETSERIAEIGPSRFLEEEAHA